MKKDQKHITLLSTEDLSIGYRADKAILSDLNLDLQAGRLTCLLGPNGCGKSTLLKVLSSGMKPLKGRVALKQKSIQDFSAKALAKTLSMVYTENLAPGNLTAYALVSLGRFPYTGWMGRLSAEDEQTIQRAMQRTGMLPLANRHVGELSDGEKQKVMIARALVQDTELMFLDEPTAHLDHPNRLEVFDMLKRLAEQDGKGILLTTHDLDMALHHADKLWLVTPNGSIVSGMPEDLVLNGSLAKTFERDHIAFDYDRGGLRKVKNSTGKSFALTGDQPGVQWLKKALERNDFKIEKDATLKIIAKTENQRWHFHFQQHIFYTLEKLINHIKHEI